MLILILGEGKREKEYRYGMETVKTSSFVRKTADLIFTSAVFTSEAIILGHRIFNFSLIFTRENVICLRDSRAVSLIVSNGDALAARFRSLDRSAVEFGN